MTSSIDQQWTIINPTNTMATTDSQPETQAPAPTTEPKIELTINAKPAEKEAHKNCTCNANPPKLNRNDTVDSDSEEEWYTRSRPQRRAPIRRYSVSPVRIRTAPPLPVSTMLSSSTQLLAKAGDFDGIADMPYPARSSAYLTTYPFTDRDVKKHAWLIASGVEDTFMSDLGGRADAGDDDNGAEFPALVRTRRRDRSPFYDPGTSDIPSIYLSRALDPSVVPEDSALNVRFLIVVQNRARPAGSKLMVAESRKAAGIMMFYEALTGNSIVFVGAVVHSCKRMARMKVKRVESLEEAVTLQQDGEGVVGVVC
ncbi:hypothetical protein BS50DRAFT_198705 [Corynespora cassiicola Philippines]|uniref:Uncharacterized protein n=1 Tax=Corynespora cassiicola Philippines TaxID=1448308 RepID=A0A2T2N5U7_CORCC|nr:hypothetical protein BS50DRAFT_198705 [Corynespora cassiicola Philippines]